MRRLVLTAGILIFIVESVAYGEFGKIEADKDSSFVSYHVYHLFHSAEAISKDISCEIDIDSITHKLVGASAEAHVSSFNSGNEARDKTAMKAIESDKFPNVAFHSDSIIYNSDTSLSVWGKLTFHGVTKEIVIPITIVSKTIETICDGSVRLEFDDFDVKRPSLLFIPIGNDFVVRFHMIFDRQL